LLQEFVDEATHAEPLPGGDLKALNARFWRRVKNSFFKSRYLVAPKPACEESKPGGCGTLKYLAFSYGPASVASAGRRPISAASRRFTGRRELNYRKFFGAFSCTLNCHQAGLRHPSLALNAGRPVTGEWPDAMIMPSNNRLRRTALRSSAKPERKPKNRH
jgi:hypothetical protein